MGARFTAFAGWDLPLQYTGIVAEHEAVRTAAGVFDVSHLGRARVAGPAAAGAIRSVTTFNVLEMQPGSAHYSLYCNAQGGIDDDVFVYRLAGDRWLVVHNAANADTGFARLSAAAGDATEVTEETVMLAVQGPRALGILGQVLRSEVDALAEHECQELPWETGSVLVARTGYTGEDGAECIADPELGQALWDAIVAAGALPAGLGARDTLRLEAALPLHGNDIDATTNVYEAGLGWAVSLDDGADFTGREALLAAKRTPRNRKLACLASPQRAVLRPGYGVLRPPGAPLATLTSGAFSPTLRKGIGMAYLPLEAATPGTPLAVDVRGRPVDVTVVRRPFYRRK
jgi:aminomethyltransferase